MQAEAPPENAHRAEGATSQAPKTWATLVAKNAAAPHDPKHQMQQQPPQQLPRPAPLAKQQPNTVRVLSIDDPSRS